MKAAWPARPVIRLGNFLFVSLLTAGSLSILDLSCRLNNIEHIPPDPIRPRLYLLKELEERLKTTRRSANEKFLELDSEIYAEVQDLPLMLNSNDLTADINNIIPVPSNQRQNTSIKMKLDHINLDEEGKGQRENIFARMKTDMKQENAVQGGKNHMVKGRGLGAKMHQMANRKLWNDLLQDAKPKGAHIAEGIRKPAPKALLVRRKRQRLDLKALNITSNSSAFRAVLGKTGFMYSVIAFNSSARALWDTMAVNIWEFKLVRGVTYHCCFKYSDNEIIATRQLDKHEWIYIKHGGLQAKQVICPIPKFTNTQRLTGLTLVSTDLNCPTESKHYIKPVFPVRLKGTTFAVCTKLAYGDLEAEKLIEWFEIQRYLGVNKVLAYTYKLNPIATRVLKYYESIGVAETFPFDLPLTDIFPRDVGTKSMQGWNDEQVVTYDCQMRLRGYKYVGLYDTDEFVIPKQNINLPRFMDKMLLERPRASGLTFMVEVFATTWGKANKTSDFFTTQYYSKTEPMFDRVKNVFVSDRVKIGTLSTHTYGSVQGYKKPLCPVSKATIKHYRTCRKEWINNTKMFKPNKCEAMKRITDRSMVPIIYKVANAIRSLRKSLNVPVI